VSGASPRSEFAKSQLMLNSTKSIGLIFAVLMFCMASTIGFGQQISSLTIAPNPVTAGEVATGTVTLSKAAGSAGLKIELTSSEVSVATVPASIIVASGSKTATFDITTVHVAMAGKTTITGKDPSAKTAKDILTVEPPVVRISELKISPTAVTSPKAATGTVTLTADAPSAGFQIDLTSSQSFATVPASLTVKPGAKTAAFTITTTAVQADETATIRAADSNGYAETASLKVTPAAIRLTKVAISASTVTAANPATGTITLSADAPTGGFVVDLSTGQTFISLPTSVTVKAGTSTAKFTVGTKPVSTAGLVTVTAKDVNGYSDAASFTVEIPAVHLSGLTIATSAVYGGASATGTVSLSAVAPKGGLVVTLSTMQPYVKLPLNVTVPSGSKSATFTVNTIAVTSPSAATIYAADINGYSASASLTVNPLVGTNISMTGVYTFSPQSVTVAAGSVVIWTNTATDGMNHTASADVSGLGPASGIVSPGQVYTWTVPANAKSGTNYFYHCNFHGFAGNGKSLGSGMCGVIIVK